MRRTLFSTSITIMHVPCHEANLGDSRTSPLDSTTLAPALLLPLPFLWVLLPETIASFYRKGSEREEKRYRSIGPKCVPISTSAVYNIPDSYT